jgi:hypothetical protein
MKIRATIAALALAGTLSLAGAQGAAASAAAVSEFLVYSPSGTVTLTCGPEGGTHPATKEACAEIDKAAGDIAAVPPLPGQGCTGVWDPVLIGVTGKWQGKEVLFSSFESNEGCARIRHGHIFRY